MTRFTPFQLRYHERLETDPRLSPDAKRIGYALSCYIGPGTLARCSWLQLRKATGLGHHRVSEAVNELHGRNYVGRRQSSDPIRTGWPLTQPR